VFTALESRFKASVILCGGFVSWSWPPEIDPFNFAPRVTVPTLMLHGRYDPVRPLETSGLPQFDALAGQKKRVEFDSGHIPPRNLIIKEILDWLDRYLGPVKHESQAG
jgi:pimeloyl-ACP methyl ester carboxylesterase